MDDFVGGGAMSTITAVAVNHNTSGYMELMLRSYDRHHTNNVIAHWELYDNASLDDTTLLFQYAAQRGTPIIQSGFSTKTSHVSHGELLRRGINAHPDSAYFVLFDADVVFMQDDTIPRLLSELEAQPSAWAIGVAPSWDGINEIPAHARTQNPDICDARLHPSCAVIRNSPIFKTVLETIGLGTYVRHTPHEETYLDTCKLLTMVMRTHGFVHLVSQSVLVKHFFCTSYEWDDAELRNQKLQTRDQLLVPLRAQN